MDTLRADLRQYGPGKKLTLFPHSPPDPHGRSTYKVPDGLKEKRILSEREEDMSMTALCFDDDNRPHLLDTSQHGDPANSLGVEIIESLSNGNDGDNQVLLVKILHKPTTDLKFPVPDTHELAVVKIFDPLFFPEDVPEEEGPWKVTSRADMKLSREAGAYKELHAYNLTGYPHLAPQYYGCWTTCLTSHSPDFEGKTRHIGLVLLEYIQGTSIRDICRHGADEVLIPPKGRICVHTDGPDSFKFTEEKRLDILALLLAGVVEQVYKGVWHEYVEPENVLITIRNKSAILEAPRVALIAYDICTIDSKCKKPMNRWERFPHTAHPSKCFDPARVWWLVASQVGRKSGRGRGLALQSLAPRKVWTSGFLEVFLQSCIPSTMAVAREADQARVGKASEEAGARGEEEGYQR